MKRKTETLNITPGWPEVVRIHFHVLRNVAPRKRVAQMAVMEKEFVRLAEAYEAALKQLRLEEERR